MKHEHINEIKAIVILAVGLILLASFVSFVPSDLPWYTSNPNNPARNLISVVGAYIAGANFFVFGYSAYALVIFMFFWSWNKFTSREIDFTAAKFISSVVLLCVISGLFGLIGPQESVERFQRAGFIGICLSDFLAMYTGAGSYIILFTLAILTTILIGEFLISPFLARATGSAQNLIGGIPERMQEQFEMWMWQWSTRSREKKREEQPSFLDRWRANQQKAAVKTTQADKAEAVDGETGVSEEYDEDTYEDEEYGGQEFENDADAKPSIRITGDQDSKKSAPARKPKSVGNYTIPSLDLLDDPPEVSARDLENDLVNGARILEETLADFNVSVRVADIERGPVITRYELQPAPGVKVNKITTLSDDIALAMRAPSVRIVAPIPGKNRVGIEVPNGGKASVYLKDVLSQSEYQNSPSKLMLALGKDIAGKPIIFNLAEMPHLLIAGTTGSGKTVCVNSLIMSLLFHASPDEVKLLMVDPKMVELTQYNGLPHCLCPAVTDAKKVASALNWVVGEMEARYQTLSSEGVRNIQAYHAKGGEMPYIVVLIDELADLMQVSAKTIESAITRLAQLSRAVGIHLVLATQRPSVDVITGVIKANFPARISFKVASKVDSRTVLDMNGAENLIGRGDMLFLKPGDAKPTRGQCSFVQDNEIDRVISFIKNQQEPEYDEEILQHKPAAGPGGSEEKDELYDEAVQLIIETNQASVSILQRRMRLGYTRAARLIDMMEQAGIVGPYCGSKPRDILIDREEWMLKNMKNKPNGGE